MAPRGGDCKDAPRLYISPPAAELLGHERAERDADTARASPRPALPPIWLAIARHRAMFERQPACRFPAAPDPPRIPSRVCRKDDMSASRVETATAHALWLASETASIRRGRIHTLVLLRDSLLSVLLLAAVGALVLAVPVVGQLLAF